MPTAPLVLAPPPGKPGVVLVPSAVVHIDIHRQVQQVLKDLPTGHSRALVSVQTGAGFNLAVAHRFDQYWTVEAWIGKSGWSKPVEGGAVVMFSM